MRIKSYRQFNESASICDKFTIEQIEELLLDFKDVFDINFSIIPTYIIVGQKEFDSYSDKYSPLARKTMLSKRICTYYTEEKIALTCFKVKPEYNSLNEKPNAYIVKMTGGKVYGDSTHMIAKFLENKKETFDVDSIKVFKNLKTNLTYEWFIPDFILTSINIPITERYDIKNPDKIKKHIDLGGIRSVFGNIRDDRHADITVRSINKLLPDLREIMKSLKQRYKKYKLGVNAIKYLNSGANGMAFIAGDKVIKLTQDSEEANIAKSLIGKKIKRCVNYYDVSFIEDYKLYAILMDKAENLTKREEEIIGSIIDCRGKKKEIIQDLEYVKFSKQELSDYISNVSDLKKNLKKEGIPTSDLHTGNIGKIKGKLVHFDMIGSSSIKDFSISKA